VLGPEADGDRDDDEKEERLHGGEWYPASAVPTQGAEGEYPAS
jgi:hypothetical protein